MNSLIELINKKSLKKSIPDVKTGDIVKVSQKITEGAKTRIQVFEGIVISREGGNGVTASITVRKIASGVGVEKKFLLNSPNIESVKVLRSSKVRRSKIFFMRVLTGKAAKLKGKQRKMMEEIGLKEDEVENAETTDDLAPMPVEEGNQENKEEIAEIQNVVSNSEEVIKDEASDEKMEEPEVEEVKKEEAPNEKIESADEEKEEVTKENKDEEKSK